ncbi:hypothetical protein EDD37DRAFT_651760 [Exophiala viscosa]|uniref:uncharacterized protein n=1 Tax=Exophiala viscosa TaxID=2486360 RepID=UPI0021933CFB|nr:hypothetical protein EDD37DRAFT_651760 [Exophiala viscosa]
MSSSGDTAQEDNSRREGRRSPSTRPPNLVEFVDSQDPNVRSAIQRHTAYHSAAQRRDARSRLLRRSSQSRYLEWGRRPPMLENELTTSSTSSANSSLSISPTRSGSERPDLPSRSSSNQTDQESDISATQFSSLTVGEDTPLTPSPAISVDDTVLQFCECPPELSRCFVHGWHIDTNDIVPPDSNTFCSHYRNRNVLESAMTFMREHEAPRHFLLAYIYGLRWTLQSNPQDQVDAQSHLGRGTNLLWNRLQTAGHASSDANIQAVLLLIAYTADFGQSSEVQVHRDALRTMVEQRGGLDTFGHNPVLQQQLWAIEQSREFHLTFDCGQPCQNALRFPDGLGLRTGTEVA